MIEQIRENRFKVSAIDNRAVTGREMFNRISRMKNEGHPEISELGRYSPFGTHCIDIRTHDGLNAIVIFSALGWGVDNAERNGK